MTENCGTALWHRNITQKYQKHQLIDFNNTYSTLPTKPAFTQRHFSRRKPQSPVTSHRSLETWMSEEAEGNIRWSVEQRLAQTSSESQEWTERTRQLGCTDPNQHTTLLYGTCNNNSSWRHWATSHGWWVNLIIWCSYQPQLSLRSSLQELLTVPHCNTMLGRRRFSVAAPCVWNSLPLDLKTNCDSFLGFKTDLKTYLFRQDYN